MLTSGFLQCTSLPLIFSPILFINYQSRFLQVYYLQYLPYYLYAPPVLTSKHFKFCPLNVFYTDLRNSSNYFPVQHLWLGFYNRE